MTKEFLFSFCVAGSLALTQGGCMTKPILEDPHLWLEDVWSQKSLSWVREQNQKTIEHFERNPLYTQIQSEALQILNAPDKIPAISFAKGFVYNLWIDAKNPRGLYRRTSYENYRTGNPKWETVLDVDELGKQERQSWVFQGCARLRPDSDLCLMMLSEGGKDARVVREFNLKKKQFVEGGFFLPLAKSNFAWVDEDTILVATDWGPKSLTESGYARQIRLLKRGQSLPQAELLLEIPQKDMRAHVYNECSSGQCEVLIVHNKDFYRHDYHWYRKNQGLVQLQIPNTAKLQGYFQNQFYFSLTKPWKSFREGCLLKATFDNLENPELVYAPDEKSSFEYAQFGKTSVYLSVLENVTRKIYRLDPSGARIPFPSPGVGETYLLSVDPFEDRALFTFENSVTSPALFEWQGDQLTKILEVQPRFPAEGLIVEQREARSFDGTMIPYFIVRKREAQGPQPTLMTAYGGFQISLSPFYEGVQGKVWLSQGGQLVIANIRGGGEFGPRWHEAALKSRRQVAYNDLFAVTEDLIHRGETSAERLAFMGRSNGGLLAGVAMTQRPDLFKAIVIQVPLLDMLRYHQLPAGASWVSEYGHPEVPEERSYLQKYSPYQNILKGKKYPDVLIMTSTFDDRVHPGHARKFAARLEEFQIPFRYFENTEGGHSAAADPAQRAQNMALSFTFLFESLLGR
jgi:prolyl oligopeptidase